MALRGFDEAYYLDAKLSALQADNLEAFGEWDSAHLQSVLEDAGFTAESHYETWGWTEGLAPNQYFDPVEYKAAKAQSLFETGGYESQADALTAFEDAWDQDPYLHYIQWGGAEGINPSNSFDQEQYYQDKLADLIADEPDYTEENITLQDVKDAFADAGLTALEHFLLYGEEEGLSATPVSGGDDTQAPTIDDQLLEFSESATEGDGWSISAEDNVGVTSFSIISGNEDFDEDGENVFAIADDGRLFVNDSDDLGSAGDQFNLGVEVADAAGNTSTATVTVDITAGTGVTEFVDSANTAPGYDASTDDVTFVFTQGEYTYIIDGFGSSGDVLDVLDTAALTVSNDAGDDGLLDISVADSDTGSTLEIQLTGVDLEQDAAVFNVASFNDTFGGYLG